MNGKGISSKIRRTKKLQKLHAALRGILREESALPSRKDTAEENSKDNTEHINKIFKKRGRKPKKIKPEPVGLPKLSRKGYTYVMSRENQLIPKLTDEQIMERHKKADLHMRNVWNNIIKKYESVTDQGDVVDLHTGVIVEDHGHLTGLNIAVPQDSKTRYKSTLKDLVEVGNSDDEGYSIWDDEIDSSHDFSEEIGHDQESPEEEAQQEGSFESDSSFHD